VPFFLGSSPLALGWGRGEVLMPLEPLPARPVLVAHPGEAMSTADAFRRLAEQRAASGGAAPEAYSFGMDALGEWAGVASMAGNDFESVAFERIPRLVAARDAMRAAGAKISLLAGSGASLFGVFASEGARDAAVRGVGELGFTTWRAETLERWPEPALGAAAD
jgi:4-diphosphocytidyl-2-C-methyl-D-erythritol kinase